MTRRPAYTLLELIVALGSASVLMVGLSSALFIAAQGLNLDQGASASRGRADAVMGRLLADARTATRYRSVSPTAIEFDVADRTGDGAVDRMRYEWSGVVGDPLTRRLNGDSPATLLRDVRTLTFGSTPHPVAAQDVTRDANHQLLPLQRSPLLGECLEPTAPAPLGLGITLDIPSQVVPGDFMVAVIVTTGDEAINMTSSSSWTKLFAESNPGKVSLTVWTRPVIGDEDPQCIWTWSNAASSIGWIMPFCNHRELNPIAATEYDCRKNSGVNCNAPSVIHAVNNSFVLRVGAFAGDVIASTDDVSMSSHEDIWARNTSHDLSAACTYLSQHAAGGTGAGQFRVSSFTDYVTATVVISPRTPVAQ